MTMPKKERRIIVVNDKTYYYVIKDDPAADTNRINIEDSETKHREEFIIDKAVSLTPKMVEALIIVNF